MAFLARHGAGHRLLPSELNFRANIYGFKMLGVEWILSASAVGSLREDYKPLDLVDPRPVLRPDARADQHVLRRRPRRARRRSRIRSAAALERHRVRRRASAAGATVHQGGTYVCMEGPAVLDAGRVERCTAPSGFDIIGMTNLQEAKLAREAEICYTTIALVTDYDCWHPDHDSVTVEMIVANLIAEREDGAAGHRRRRRAAADRARRASARSALAHGDHHAAGGRFRRRRKQRLRRIVGKYLVVTVDRDAVT